MAASPATPYIQHRPISACAHSLRFPHPEAVLCYWVHSLCNVVELLHHIILVCATVLHVLASLLESLPPQCQCNIAGALTDLAWEIAPCGNTSSCVSAPRQQHERQNLGISWFLSRASRKSQNRDLTCFFVWPCRCTVAPLHPKTDYSNFSDSTFTSYNSFVAMKAFAQYVLLIYFNFLQFSTQRSVTTGPYLGAFKF